MPGFDPPQGESLFLAPSNVISATSSYIDDDNYHSVEIGFNLYRDGNSFYGNLTTCYL